MSGFLKRHSNTEGFIGSVSAPWYQVKINKVSHDDYKHEEKKFHPLQTPHCGLVYFDYR